MRYSLIAILLSAMFLITGCLNPFAPVLGDPSESLWTDQQTVGELLDNFRNSYNLRDSLRYSDCLDDNFTFLFYDVENARDDQWGRDTDLKTTGGLFRNFDEIHLTWYAVAGNIQEFAFEDSSLEFNVSFNLSIYGSAGGSYYDLYGLAQFTVFKEENDRFRIITWKDNSYF